MPIGAGVTLFKRDGSTLNYCSRKCEKNFKMKRNPLKFKWTQKFVKGSAVKKSSKAKHVVASASVQQAVKGENK